MISSVYQERIVRCLCMLPVWLYTDLHKFFGKADMSAKSCLRQHSKNARRDEEVMAFCNELVERYHPLKITLFGSYASGMAHEDSDVDLLVEMKHVDSALGTAAAIVRETKPCFTVDLLVRTPQHVRERIRMGDNFMIEIVNNGKVLYETADC